jgi:NhaA family Na+:H+ antiporter
VPIGLKVLLLSLAIVDDIGAVLVIALFYTSDISFAALGWAAGGFALTFLLNRSGVRRVGVYVLVGAGIWLAFLLSGVHPTIAGVMLGLMTPASAWVGDRALIDVLADAVWRFGDEGPDVPRPGTTHGVEVTLRESVSPLERLEEGLHPWVAFGIMPLFALANAGVRLEPESFVDPLALAVGLGLVVGKPLGIVLLSWIAVRLGLARLPSGVNWRIVWAGGCLAGIGFTMSLFIANLAFEPPLLLAAKAGTLAGSAVAAVAGSVLLLAFLPKQAKPDSR